MFLESFTKTSTSNSAFHLFTGFFPVFQLRTGEPPDETTGQVFWSAFFGVGDTWRIIPVTKWLITMVIISPLSRVVGPLPNGFFVA